MEHRAATALARALGTLVVGTEQARERRVRGLAAGRSGEYEQQIKLPISGSASSVPDYDLTEVSFNAPFLWAPRQRNVPFARPHFTVGVEIVSAAAFVTAEAQLHQWNVNAQGWVVGAQLQVCAWSPGAIVAVDFSAVLHLAFEGYAAPSEYGTD